MTGQYPPTSSTSGAAPDASLTLLDVFESLAHDELTGGLLRRVWMARAERELAAAAVRGARSAVLLIDLDDFKACNDAFGHPAGDVVLAEVARAVRCGLRHVDLIGRLGGDELAVLLGDDHDLQQVSAIADRLRRRVRSTRVCIPVPFEPASGRPQHEVGAGTVSIGAAVLGSRSAADLPELLAAADTALYAAKAAGRDAVRTVEVSPADRDGRPPARARPIERTCP